MENWSLCPLTQRKCQELAGHPSSRNNSQLAPDHQERVGELESHPSSVPAAAATARPDKTRSGVTTDIPQTPALLKTRGLKTSKHSDIKAPGEQLLFVRCQAGALQNESRIQGLGIHKIISYAEEIGPF